MNAIEEVLRRVETVTFDCYGTLIDWAAGLEQSFHQIFGDALAGRERELFEAYVQTEAAVEAGPYRAYRDVLATTVAGLANRFETDLPADRAGLLADTLTQWKPFADTNEALVRLKERYHLGVLSNIDRDLFDGTARHFDVRFDFVVTAEDVQGYKPGHRHFLKLLESHAERNSVLHVAQSLFHDGSPAGALGIAFVWINRYNEANETLVRPLAEYPDLKSLADAACSESS